jgi:hypothetical protein
VLEQTLRIDVFVGGIGVRKKVADIRLAGGAEQRVADGMREAVGIAVAVEAEVGGESHTAEHERASANKAVNIVAVTDSEIHGKPVITIDAKGSNEVSSRFIAGVGEPRALLYLG